MALNLKLNKNELTDKVIAKSIPYPILFIIKYQTDLCYSIKVEDSYYSEWNDNIEFDFNYNYNNLNSIYENIVKKIKEKQIIILYKNNINKY